MKILNNIKNNLDKINTKYISLVSKRKIPSIFKKKYSLLSVLGSILLLSIILINDTVSNESIPTYKIRKGEFLVSITESGELKAKKSVSVVAPRIRSSLKIVYLIPEGSYVKAGEIVAKFDPTDVLARLKEAEAKLEVSKSDKKKLLANHASQMAQMESELKSSELSFELSKLNKEHMKFEAEAKKREAELQHKKNELSFLSSRQTYKSKKIIQKSELENMDVEINQKRFDVEKAQRDLDFLTVKSEEEGLVVYDKNWNNQGQKFQVGDQPWPGQVIITLPDLSKMESHIYVNEVDISKVKVGQKVEVKLDAFQDSIFVGNVIDIARLGKKKNNQSNIKVFDVLIEIEKRSEILKPGMTTSNKLIINKIDNKVFIPHEALFEMNSELIVFKKNGSGFKEVAVKISEKSDDFVVIDEGLENEEVVALRNPDKDEVNKKVLENGSVNMPIGEK